MQKNKGEKGLTHFVILDAGSAGIVFRAVDAREKKIEDLKKELEENEASGNKVVIKKIPKMFLKDIKKT